MRRPSFTWKAYLAKLREDGVELAEWEEPDIAPDGERVISRELMRRVENRTLHYPVYFTSFESHVPWYVVRQVTNVLRLDPRKYIF